MTEAQRTGYAGQDQTEARPAWVLVEGDTVLDYAGAYERIDRISCTGPLDTLDLLITTETAAQYTRRTSRYSVWSVKVG